MILDVAQPIPVETLVRTDNGCVRTVLGNFHAGKGYDYVLLRAFGGDAELATREFLIKHPGSGNINSKLLRDTAEYQWCSTSKCEPHLPTPGAWCQHCRNWFHQAHVNRVVDGAEVLICFTCRDNYKWKYKDCPLV
jgi:hypothetical protein